MEKGILTRENDVDRNIFVYIIFPGGFAADFEYAFGYINVFAKDRNKEKIHQTKTCSKSTVN